MRVTFTQPALQNYIATWEIWFPKIKEKYFTESEKYVTSNKGWMGGGSLMEMHAGHICTGARFAKLY